jgi:cytochrome c oxidase subunit I+III
VTQMAVDFPISATRATGVELRELRETWDRPKGFYGWLTSTDHKEIGLRFIMTAMFFFTLAGLLALAMRIQLAVPLNNFMGPDRYNQFFTTHGTAMMFLFAVPVMEGFALYLVPLMVGTRNVAFPRLMNFGYYVYLIAGCALFLGLFLNMGPDVGWFAYTPLSGPQYSPGHRVDLWSQMVTLVEISTLVGAVEIITTVIMQRAVGMSLNRMPLFVWANFITSWMIIFAMPSVMLCSSMLSMDRLANIGTHFYNHAEGGDHLLWQHLFWFFAHPEVYIIFIPATGFVAAIIPAFTRRHMFGYTALVLSAIATAFIGFGVWVHHMFVTPLPDLGQGMFTAASLMIVIPNGVQIFCWVATICTGKVRLELPLIWVLGFIFVFMIGGLTGVMLASVSVDTQLHDTFFVVAHLHYVLIGGAVFPLMGAFYYWFPKWTGRMLGTKLGHLNFWLMLIGFNLTFWPMHHLGLHGMTRRIWTYVPETGWGHLNFIATIGAFTIGLSVLTFVVNVIVSRYAGVVAGANPWGAGTLEWATENPPESFNFGRPPPVPGVEPLWDNSADAPVIVGLSTEKKQVLHTTLLDAQPDHRYNMAAHTLASPMLAVCVGYLLLGGGIFNPWHAVWGAVGATLVLFVWFWTSTHNRESGEEEPEAAGDVEGAQA